MISCRLICGRQRPSPTPKAFPSLGYNPDYLMYDTFCLEFAKSTNWDPAALVKFYDYYYRRAAIEQPAAMLRKIMGQMQLFYCSKNPAYRLGQSLDVSDEYARNEDLIANKAQIVAGYAPFALYFRESNALAQTGAAIEQAKRFTEWTRLLSAHYLDLLLVAIVSPLVLLCCPPRRHLHGRS